MLSVIFYGRNDSYGYNMHKRVAISINCVAEVLNQENDEILFVDYNTPDDYPTLLEAIADLLTDKAKKIVRVFRVRPEIHNRLYSKRTHLKALEPISRNVALRRSNPKNKWILSSNTDMVFVPKTAKDLSEIISKLDSGYYCIPRFEMPESLWEMLDRKDPQNIIKKFDEWGKSLHINDVVYGTDTVLYDAPGDFQLIERKDLFDIDGFDEDMLRGWHVDWNLAKRMQLLGKPVQSLFPDIYGYHCDHTKEFTPMHTSVKYKENSLEDFVFGLTTPYITKQRSSWGLVEENIEEIRLNVESPYPVILNKLLPQNKKEYIESYYNERSYNTPNYCIEHMLPYISDLLYYQKKNTKIGYLGGNPKTIDYLNHLIAELGFDNKLKIAAGLPQTAISTKIEEIKAFDFNSFYNNIDVLIVDYATEEFNTPDNNKLSLNSHHLMSNIRYGFFRLLSLERYKPKLIWIVLNSIHTDFECFMKDFVYSKSPYSSRVRKGVLIKNLSLIYKTFGFLYKYSLVQTMLLYKDIWLAHYKTIPRKIALKLSHNPKKYLFARVIYKKLRLKFLFLSK